MIGGVPQVREHSFLICILDTSGRKNLPGHFTAQARYRQSSYLGLEKIKEAQLKLGTSKGVANRLCVIQYQHPE
jgi:hypothetical protein